jgi:hypothetical protein
MYSNVTVVHQNRKFTQYNLSPKAPQPVVGQGVLIIEASRPLRHAALGWTRGGLISQRQRPQLNTNKKHTSTTPTEVEPTIPTSEWPLGSTQSVMECKNCLEHLHITYTQYDVTVCTANQRNDGVLQGSSLKRSADCQPSESHWETSNHFRKCCARANTLTLVDVHRIPCSSALSL